MTINTCEHTAAPATLEVADSDRAPRFDGRNRDSKAILPLDPTDAKEKLVQAGATKAMITGVLAIGMKKPALMSALVDRFCSTEASKAIAERYSVNESVLSWRSKRLGFPERRRGRPSLLVPTPKHQRILRLVSQRGIVETAKEVHLSKQRVHQITRRWSPGLKSPRPMPKRKGSFGRKQDHVQRSLVVSFRITSGQWQRLLAAQLTGGDHMRSGGEKARAIVLKFIDSPDGGPNGVAQYSTRPVPTMVIAKPVNV
jgi:hypothetical protein